MTYEQNSAPSQVAAQAADRLLGFYPSITASDPEVYAAGLVQLFGRYPASIVAQAIDAVDGLPGKHKYSPSIAEAKALLDELHAAERQRRYFLEKAKEPKAIEPPPDPEARDRVGEQMRKLADRLRNGPSAA